MQTATTRVSPDWGYIPPPPSRPSLSITQTFETSVYASAFRTTEDLFQRITEQDVHPAIKEYLQEEISKPRLPLPGRIKVCMVEFDQSVSSGKAKQMIKNCCLIDGRPLRPLSLLEFLMMLPESQESVVVSEKHQLVYLGSSSERWGKEYFPRHYQLRNRLMLEFIVSHAWPPGTRFPVTLDI